ncbi:tetratricopeptide repeat protein [Algibacter sp. 2305UL17-15]|uniref:tetratricopeptide repeat protein n=1 Tax=Algibacter sp. 2305UL17-15 TaxID=3231268 RepID=UPI00345A395D
MNKPAFTYTLIIIFLIFPVISFGQSKKLVRKGKRLADPNQRMTHFTKAIALDSENLDAYFYRGLARANLEDHWGAILDFTTIIVKKPDADSYYNRGSSKFILGDYKGAYHDYAMAIRLDRDFFQAYFDLGITLINLEKYAEALQSFLFLANHFPNDAEIQNQIGLTLMELKHFKLALLFFNKSIKLNRSSNTFYNRGMAYLEMKQFKKALTDFDKAISIDKTNDAAHFYHGIAQLFSRNYAKAAASFENTLSFNALDHEALVGLSIAYYHTNKYDKAKQYFRKAKNILWSESNYPIDDVSLFNNTSWNLDQSNIIQAYFNKLNTL